MKILRLYAGIVLERLEQVVRRRMLHLPLPHIAQHHDNILPSISAYYQLSEVEKLAESQTRKRSLLQMAEVLRLRNPPDDFTTSY